MPLPLTLLLVAMLLPLGAFAVLVMLGRRMGTTLCGIVGTLATLGALTCAVVVLMSWLGGGVWAGEPWGPGRATLAYVVPWARSLPVGLYVDSLTVLTVTCGLLASTAVHVFTTGYLRHDVRGPRIFALLALADASFIGLMTAPTPLQWAAWATVGSLAAYLMALPVPLGPGGLGVTPVPRGLTRGDLPERASASLAVLGWRLGGDVLLVAACGAWVGSFAERVGGESLSWWAMWGVSLAEAGSRSAGAVGWCLAGAAVCYALAFPASLFVPDAKGAPTPASGLCYAVTLLPTGPLLLVRTFPLLSDAQLLAIAAAGGLTLVTAACAALAELDLRRLLAWVATGAVGVALAGVGSGSPGGAILHVVACIFGTTLLLLAGGSVLHACLGEHRLWHYGGLLFRMPASAVLLAHGAATVLGGPVLAGSVSWQTILTHAYRSMQSGEPAGWLTLAGLGIGGVLLAAGLGRLWALLMLDVPRDRAVYAAARESATLTVPVAALAVAATIAGQAAVAPTVQLVAALPAEMSGVVAGPEGPMAIVTGSGEPPRGVPGWREVRPPPVTPPPLRPEDEGLLDVADSGAAQGADRPPDTRIPQAIDPVRWMLGAFGAVLGLLLAGRGRGTPTQRHAAEAVARGLYVPWAVRRALALGCAALAFAAGVVERVVLVGSVDGLSRVLLPLGVRPGRAVAAVRRATIARALGSAVLLVTMAAAMMSAVAVYVLSHSPRLEVLP